MQLTMQFKLFNATTMHNSTEKCQKNSKNQKSDLNLKKNPIYDFFQPCVRRRPISHVVRVSAEQIVTGSMWPGDY